MQWPIHTWHPPVPPAKLVFDQQHGEAHDSLLSAGVIIAGGTVHSSVLSPLVRVQRGARVEGAVLLDSVRVGYGARVRNAILDKNVIVEDGAEIGIDPQADRERFHVSENGIVVVEKNQVVTAR
jgi:glucose-1-phosphate adenylyltransferase